MLFMFGMLGSLAAYSPKNSNRTRYLSLALFLVAALGMKLAIHFFKARMDGQISMDLLVGLVAAAAMTYAAIAPHSLLTRALSWKPLAFVGTFAYSIYLIHAPLLQCEWLVLRAMHVSDTVGFVAGCFIGLPIIVALSYVFFWFCERPFLTRRKTA